MAGAHPIELGIGVGARRAVSRLTGGLEFGEELDG
jgi:hypothetical protein